MLPEILKTLNLEKSEVEIFMQLARLGSAPASRIAGKIGLKRTTCYQLLENLVQRNILKRSLKFKTRYYAPASPKELAILLDKQITPLNDAKALLEKNTKDISSFYYQKEKNTEIAFYEGFDEIKLIYDKLLQQNDKEIFSVIKKHETTGHYLKSYWQKYLNQRIKLGKKSFSLVQKDQYSQVYIRESVKEKRQTIAVAEKDLKIFGDLKVSGDLVALVSQQEGRIFGITIEDPRIAAMFKGMLKILWKHFEKK
jgi:sugar-specific transcriptional regulator TrmB